MSDTSLRKFQDQFIWVDVSYGHKPDVQQCQVVKATDKQMEVRESGSKRTRRLLISDHGDKWWDCEEHAMITVGRVNAARAIQNSQRAVDFMREVDIAHERLRQLNLKKRYHKEEEA